MKTMYFTLLIGGLFFFVSCENKENNDIANIKYITTTLGGCNNEVGLRSDVFDKDTVIISKDKETIQVFVSHNYICGAPFKTECEIKNDSIFMYIIDTCEDPPSCYQRCDCFYTFDFKFTYQGENKYKYKIVLFDPRETESKTISTGLLKFN
jgi:hypothetical protein